MHSQFAQFKAGSDDGFAQMFALIQAVDMRHGLLRPVLAISGRPAHREQCRLNPQQRKFASLIDGFGCLADVQEWSPDRERNKAADEITNYTPSS